MDIPLLLATEHPAVSGEKENPLFSPSENCCYVCKNSKAKLFEQGAAVGKLCEFCALGFEY